MKLRTLIAGTLCAATMALSGCNTKKEEPYETLKNRKQRKESDLKRCRALYSQAQTQVKAYNDMQLKKSLERLDWCLEDNYGKRDDAMGLLTLIYETPFNLCLSKHQKLYNLAKVDKIKANYLWAKILFSKRDLVLCKKNTNVGHNYRMAKTLDKTYRLVRKKTIKENKK